jgi:hypothetical protein
VNAKIYEVRNPNDADRIPWGVKKRLRKQIDIFVKMGYRVCELAVVARIPEGETFPQYEIVPFSVVGRGDK